VRFMNGWLRIERKTALGDIGDCCVTFTIWMKLLSMATVAPTKVRMRDGEKRTIEAGSVVTSYSEIAQDLRIMRKKVSRFTVARCVRYLEVTKRLRTEPAHRGTLITICNWTRFNPKLNHTAHDPLATRSDTALDPLINRSRIERVTDNGLRGTGEEYINREADAPPLRCGATPDESFITDEQIPFPGNAELKSGASVSQEQVNTNPESLNGETDSERAQPVANSSGLGFELPAKKSDKPSKKPPKKHATPRDRALAMRWGDWAKSKWPSIKVDIDRWSEAIAKVKRVVDNLGDDQMDGLFEFVKADDFWSDVSQSPCSLLKKSKNDLRKIDNILAALRKKHYKNHEAMAHARARDGGQPVNNEGFAF